MKKVLYIFPRRLVLARGPLSWQVHGTQPWAMDASCRRFLNDKLPPDVYPQHVIDGFRAAVNMSPEELEAFLASNESRQAVEDGPFEDKEGRHMARRVVELLRKTDDTLYEGDLEHMWRITQYIKCHKDTMQKESMGPLERYHCMNYGFDPAKHEA